MNLQPYIDDLQRELAIAAEAGGEDARALAERLTAPLDAAVRLTLLDALATAAQEISRDLAPGAVEVRLRGRDPDFVVVPAPMPAVLASAGATEGDSQGTLGPTAPIPPAWPDGDEGGTLRINLRLPEGLKLRVEEAARRERLSINAWLVRAVATALATDGHERQGAPRGKASGQRLTGWVR